MRKQLLVTLLIIASITLSTLAVILYAKGYRIIKSDSGEAKLLGTGILAATSKPDGARVLINGKLETATNNSINLAPGEYDVEIVKDGYFPWKKRIVIQKESVSQANALLLPLAPRLDALTTTGAQNPITDPTQSLIAYAVSSSSAEKNGIYILDANKPFVNLVGITRQIANDIAIPFSRAKLLLSPDGSSLLAEISPETPQGSREKQVGKTYYLLSTSSFNNAPQDVTLTVDQIKLAWQKQEQDKQTKAISAQNSKVQKMIYENFANTLFSPDENKILYTASRSAELPIIISPRIPGANSTPEQRNIKKGNIYVYDIKEDRNYLLWDKPLPPKFFWYPDSSHLFFVEDKKINFIEYDATNKTTVYAGPLASDFVSPWPDGSGIIILTNLISQDSPPNLYKLTLK